MVWEVRETSQTAKTQSPAWTRASLDPGDLVVHLLDGAVRQLHLHPGDVTVNLLDEDVVVLLHLHDHGDVVVLLDRWYDLPSAYDLLAAAGRYDTSAAETPRRCNTTREP